LVPAPPPPPRGYIARRRNPGLLFFFLSLSFSLSLSRPPCFSSGCGVLRCESARQVRQPSLSPPCNGGGGSASTRLLPWRSPKFNSIQFNSIQFPPHPRTHYPPLPPPSSPIWICRFLLVGRVFSLCSYPNANPPPPSSSPRIHARGSRGTAGWAATLEDSARPAVDHCHPSGPDTYLATPPPRASERVSI